MLKLIVSITLTSLFLNFPISKEANAKSLTGVDNTASITSLQKSENHKVLSESSISPSYLKQTFLISQVNFDLNGVWRSNDGGVYYVRQINNQLWWYGESAGIYTNVFQGTIIGNAVIGQWVDVPKGINRNAGSLSILIISNNQFVQSTLQSQSGFYPTQWTRF
ncbi:MAG: hypothetical protein HWQ41_03220 [Nostoc sp. NOS(2021)]|uniref:hypothetical protein n=1 Tax=Nostoc sp. NOS(2021) TaxID=2815407 RepID=UPI0025F6F5A6|nr:hypothetical protein [Nostoc sp. NOS(2021)]MBN3894304.1 hypothetical protein [Nostoc sp. NOS(2021)]